MFCWCCSSSARVGLSLQHSARVWLHPLCVGSAVLSTSANVSAAFQNYSITDACELIRHFRSADYWTMGTRLKVEEVKNNPRISEVRKRDSTILRVWCPSRLWQQQVCRWVLPTRLSFCHRVGSTLLPQRTPVASGRLLSSVSVAGFR